MSKRVYSILMPIKDKNVGSSVLNYINRIPVDANKLEEASQTAKFIN